MRVVSALMFYPRGGSSHAARALTRGLRQNGWDVTLIAGSRSDLGATADAHNFYGEVQAVDFGPALQTRDPLRFDGVPLHPSYEDRPGAPDRVFASLDDLEYERQVQAWAAQLNIADAKHADVLHLHHLTPINEAAARVAPLVPVVGQLHGTELLMLEQIAEGPPDSWRHAERWAARLRAWAQRCTKLVVVPAGVERAVKLLDVDPRKIAALPNGVDTSTFTPRSVDRRQFWRRVLVDEPQGALPDEPAGSAHYASADVDRLAAGVILLYVGRFTAVKRLDRLIAAYTRARLKTDTPAGLVLVGGHPGEWEGEHPATIASNTNAPDVYLAGWYDQASLPDFFSAADAVVMSSAREQFGQVLVEGMACGIPAVAPRMLGPASIIEDGTTGWLFEPGDGEALAATLTNVIDAGAERVRRGTEARHTACERFSWTGISAELASVLGQVAAAAPRVSARAPGAG